ncbi:MAG: thioredoxin family protein [Bacilli bacterium]|nr:thioredoxin family protein [Bacilli bacterium]
MKIVRINAMWCSGCLYMKKVWKEVEKEYPNLDIETYDYDMDEDIVKSYNPGTILPVIIFYKDGEEYKRLNGEKKKEEIIEIIKECL